MYNLEDRCSIAVCFLIAFLLLPSALAAQSDQYRVPGLFDDYDGRSTLERIDDSLEESRWRLGRLYVEPWYALREISYDERESSSSRSDLNVTVGAGLRGYLPFGSRFVLAGHVLPEYVWWRDRRGRGTVNGRYGLGLFGRSGRLALEATGTREDSARFLSREVEERIETRDDRGTLKVEVSITPSVALFTVGTVRELEFENNQDRSGVVELNRSEEVVRGGVRFPSSGRSYRRARSRNHRH